MLEFILDVNVDCKPKSEGYPKYLFDDLRSAKRVRLVLGGTKYRDEVKKKKGMVELFSEFYRSGKVRACDDASVNKKEAEINKKIVEKLRVCPSECDDQHILAMSLVSNCRNVVTKDMRMAACRDKIRGKVGHEFCPDIRLVTTEKIYRETT